MSVPICGFHLEYTVAKFQYGDIEGATAEVKNGDRVVVGVNKYQSSSTTEGVGEIFNLDPEMRDGVVAKYEAIKDTRDAAEVETSLANLRQAAQSDDENLMPYLVDCCHAYATVGEMVDVLKSQWGEFQEPALTA